MAWIKLDHDFPDHRKVLSLSDAAFRLHIHAMCYAGRMLSDGVLSRVWLTGGKGRKVPKAATELVNAGLWYQEPSGDYIIHDFLTYQRSRAQIEQQRTDAAERMKRLREVRANKTRSSEEVRSTDRDIDIDKNKNSSEQPQLQVVPQWPRAPRQTHHRGHIHQYCDWVCLPEFLFNEFVNKCPSGIGTVDAWAKQVRRSWQGKEVTEDNLKFWRERWAERPMSSSRDAALERRGQEHLAKVAALEAAK